MRIILAVLVAAAIGLSMEAAVADDAKAMTVASIQEGKANLAGQQVRFEGNVVKVNNGIMKRNFVHVQDGTGSGPLIVTSTQTAAVGNRVAVTGRVVLNRDFGMGYQYPLLVEEATITVK